MSTSTNKTNDSVYTYYLDKGLSGNLGAQPELLTAKNGKRYAKATLYCNFKPENNDESTAAPAQASMRIIALFWDIAAQKAHDELHKGDFVALFPRSIRVVCSQQSDPSCCQYQCVIKLMGDNCFSVLKRAM